MSSRDHETIPIVPQKARETNETMRTTTAETLPADLVRDMSERFGVDFGAVRIHRDGAADRAARSERAQAFTRGSDISFATGRYNPATAVGKQLIAHELAHVVQQQRPGMTADSEARAESASHAAAGGHDVDMNALGSAPVGVQTKPDDPPQQTDKPAEEAPANDPRKQAYVLDKFVTGKDALTETHVKQIDDIAFSIGLHTGILARGKARIEIVGHADTVGKDPRNDELGQQRADRVREALAKKLTPAEGQKPIVLEWSVRSAGEKELLVPTADNTPESRNRAVEIRVTIESMPAPKPPPRITLDPGTIVVDEPQPTPPRRRQDDNWWQKAEENQRKIDEYDKKHPRKKESLQDVITGGIEKAVDPIIKKLPISDSKKKWLREKLKDGVEAGLEKACESAVDAAGVSGQDADALKKACKAAIQQKVETK